MNDLARNDFGLDKTVGETHRLICPSCKRYTNHKVLRSITHDWATAGNDICGYDDYTIVQCLGCEGISYATTSSDSESMDDDGGYAITLRQYPEVNIEHTAITLPYSTPVDVREAYNEASKALSYGLTHLGAIGMRLIIELICKAENGVGKNLFERIDSLREQHIISESVADTIHGIRFFGNDAVHDNKVKTHELNAAWQTVNILISYIYGAQDNKEMLLTPTRVQKLKEARIKQSRKTERKSSEV